MSDASHTAAVTCALFGLGIGVVNYGIVLRMMAAAFAPDGTGLDEDAAARAALLGRVQRIRRWVLVCCFGVLPGVGYLAGAFLGH